MGLLKVRTRKMPLKITKEHVEFIKLNYLKYSNVELSRNIGCHLATVNNVLRKLGLSRPNFRTSFDMKKKVVDMLEDFWANGLTPAEASRKHGIVQSAVSSYTSMLFSKKLTDDTEIRVFKSKV